MTDQDFEMPALRLGRPAPSDGEARLARQRELGLASVPDSVFDEVARKAAESTGATAAMVNLVGERGQYFVGLYDKEPAAGDPAFLGDLSRFMNMDEGFCVHVVGRKAALTLDDVFEFSRFRGNPVVDELGVRSYIGVPLIDDDGTVIGTVCAIDPAPRGEAEGNSWGNQGLQVFKEARDQVLAEIGSRQRVNRLLAEADGPVMITASPGLAVLYANSRHEQLFGAIEQLGTPAPEAFPHLAPVGILAIIEHLERGGDPMVTPPIPLTGPPTTTITFASVPVRVPGQDAAVLTFGLTDTDAVTCLARAKRIAADIGGEPDDNGRNGNSGQE